MAVAGAGVFGLCTALRLAAAGAAVDVWDPAPLGDNASGVAGGMIAPAGETLFDTASARHFPLFAAARAGWRALEALAPQLIIHRSGACFLFDGPQARDAALMQLIDAGGSGALLEPENDSRAALFTPDDWRVDAPVALLALAAAIRAVGGVFRPEALTPANIGDYDAVVLATGMFGHPFIDVVPELAALTPIKGHILRFAAAPHEGPIQRSASVYLSPQPGGVLAGATMEAGRDDRSLDPAVVDALYGRAIGLDPTLAPAPFQAFTGVRAATPDGLPLAGPSRHPGVLLAAGARRNGWLLAPLVSQIIVSYLEGGDGGAYAPAFDPRRAFQTR